MHSVILAYAGLVALGVIVSSYGTLIGAGGGFILMPLLLLLYPHDNPHELTAISLACVLLNTVSGTAAYARMKRIDFRSGLLFASATLPGAVLGVLCTAAVSRRLFEGIFAVFLVGLALFMIFRPKSDAQGKKPVQTPHASGGRKRHTAISMDGIIFEYDYNRMLGLGIFFFLGFLVSFMGIGGGSLMVPTLIYVLNFPIFIATGTAQLMVAILTCTATAVHAGIGSFNHGGVHRMIAIGGGMLIGAQLGARLSNRIKGVWIVRSLAAALMLVGIRMIIAIL